jgi:hypothetical protein
MGMQQTKPRAVKVVGWCSIVLGLFAALSGAGSTAAQYINYGAISEYGAILQILVGGLMVSSSIYLIKGRRIARGLLEVTLWLALLGSLGWVAAQESDFRNTLAIAMLQLWIPLGLLIYGVRKNTVRSFVNGT